MRAIPVIDVYYQFSIPFILEMAVANDSSLRDRGQTYNVQNAPWQPEHLTCFPTPPTSTTPAIASILGRSHVP